MFRMNLHRMLFFLFLIQCTSFSSIECVAQRPGALCCRRSSYSRLFVWKWCPVHDKKFLVDDGLQIALVHNIPWWVIQPYTSEPNLNSFWVSLLFVGRHPHMGMAMHFLLRLLDAHRVCYALHANNDPSEASPSNTTHEVMSRLAVCIYRVLCKGVCSKT